MRKIRKEKKVETFRPLLAAFVELSSILKKMPYANPNVALNHYKDLVDRKFNVSSESRQTPESNDVDHITIGSEHLSYLSVLYSDFNGHIVVLSYSCWPNIIDLTEVIRLKRKPENS